MGDVLQTDNNRFLGWMQSTFGGGMRSSAATAYLSPKFQARPNMHILLQTRATRILKTSGPSDLTLRTVELTSGTGTKLSVNCNDFI